MAKAIPSRLGPSSPYFCAAWSSIGEGERKRGVRLDQDLGIFVYGILAPLIRLCESLTENPCPLLNGSDRHLRRIVLENVKSFLRERNIGHLFYFSLSFFKLLIEYFNFFFPEGDEELNGRLVQLGEVLSEIEEGGGGRRGLEEGWRAMISMELPAHATQHGALHLGVGVGVNPGDPAGSALAAIHPHPQDPLALHHHNHGAATPGGMHEDSKKKRMFLLTNPLFLINVER